jgi:thiamine-monophosphate kinase
MDEFDLIRRFFTPDEPGPGVVRGPGDDAAVVQPTPGRQLVITTDTLVEHRHFPADLPPGDVAWRSLAANLSDLAAMGAEPRWCLLALTLPEADEAWLANFSDGFFQLAHQVGIELIGGDLNRGPLSVTVQALGEVEPDRALCRGGARAGDRIAVGGVPGEAAAGLRLWQDGERDGPLVERFRRPRPQLALGTSLCGLARACIDISDGLVADLEHLLDDTTGASLEAARLPVSEALRAWPADQRLGLQCGGGDDYLLLFLLPPEAELPPGCFEIGRVTEAPGIRLYDESGNVMPPVDPGWKHFR